MPSRKGSIPSSYGQRKEDFWRTQEKKLWRESLHANAGAFSIRLRLDQKFLCIDLNLNPQKGILPPGLHMGTFRKPRFITTARRSRVLLVGLLGYEWRINTKILNQAGILPRKKIRLEKCGIKPISYDRLKSQALANPDSIYLDQHVFQAR